MEIYAPKVTFSVLWIERTLWIKSLQRKSYLGVFLSKVMRWVMILWWFASKKTLTADILIWRVPWNIMASSTVAALRRHPFWVNSSSQPSHLTAVTQLRTWRKPVHYMFQPAGSPSSLSTSSLKVCKASGPDDIPARTLREIAQDLVPTLSLVFNQSLAGGVIPNDLKNAHVSPIHKGCKHQVDNYPPISLTCICSKLLEHVVCHHIMSHLEEHNILTHLQHGFRSGMSMIIQRLVTTQDIYQWDKKTQVDIAVLDFAKAFDKVPHQNLLNKLHHYGIDNNIHTWITSFLNNCIQSIVIDGATSPLTNVISGVPQGTVLGP